ncbi:hypothetical protein GCM10012275_41770 [Longimycelium tulufanense]|uniref:Uncharacterized protein n=1 Tax=Longimycelium tulufanense TaxID=907463 RepID=A0A8J3CGT2_9PSEU|nr:hypothetical protein [Longimycelium tulufanense]GGM66952.1 hypothetical protein GCM10012275_41770 [Longimycelium tulufanense]
MKTWTKRVAQIALVSTGLLAAGAGLSSAAQAADALGNGQATKPAGQAAKKVDQAGKKVGQGADKVEKGVEKEVEKGVEQAAKKPVKKNPTAGDLTKSLGDTGSLTKALGRSGDGLDSRKKKFTSNDAPGMNKISDQDFDALYKQYQDAAMEDALVSSGANNAATPQMNPAAVPGTGTSTQIGNGSLPANSEMVQHAVPLGNKMLNKKELSKLDEVGRVRELTDVTKVAKQLPETKQVGQVSRSLPLAEQLPRADDLPGGKLDGLPGGDLTKHLDANSVNKVLQPEKVDATTTATSYALGVLAKEFGTQFAEHTGLSPESFHPVVVTNPGGVDALAANLPAEDLTDSTKLAGKAADTRSLTGADKHLEPISKLLKKNDTDAVAEVTEQTEDAAAEQTDTKGAQAGQ